MFSTCPSVRPSVRSSIRYQTCDHDILKTNEWNLLHIGIIGSRGNGQLWYNEVEGQGHTMPKLHLEAWRRHHL